MPASPSPQPTTERLSPEAVPVAYEISAATAEQAKRGEDRILCDTDRHIYAVVDGMGGLAGGAVAAQVIRDAFAESLATNTEPVVANNVIDRLRVTFTQGHAALRAAAARGEGGGNMGAVATLILPFENDDGTYGIGVGHVGDTRLLMQEGQGSPVVALTQDEGEGNIVKNCFVADKKPPQLTQFFVIPVVGEDTRIAIVSDGISGDWPEQFLTDAEYQQAFDMNSEQAAADELIRLSKKDDDKSVIIVDISSVSEPLAAPSPAGAPSATTHARPATARANTATTANRAPTSDAELTRLRNERRLETQLQALVEAREEYARLVAGRGRRHVSRKYSKKAVAAAEKAYYDARGASLKLEVAVAIAAGVSREDLLNYEDEFAAGDAAAVAKAVYAARLQATGDFQNEDEQGVYKAIPSKTPFGKAVEHFYNWWGEQSSSKFFSWATLKKAGAMGVLGAGAGVPAALAASLLLGPIGGGALGALAASKIAKGVMTYKVHKRAGHSINHIDELDEELQSAIDDRSPEIWRISSLINPQMEREVFSNRLRLAGSIGAAAVSGALSELGMAHVLEHSLGLGLDGHHGSAHHNGHSASKPTGAQAGARPQTQPASSHQPGGHSARGGGGSGRSISLEITDDNDSIWNEVSQYATRNGYNGHDNAAVQRATQLVLNQSGLNWDQARVLPDHFRFNLPPHLLEEFTKTKTGV